ncbi:cytochrome b/b6 domain-containing protein [Aurantiacibacter odishensis]|uniref:cytochrome b/b6 domain-containing protein n=1 Tax=Aurantiacibacter odishensis TaxID=1155476 RepID=UPI001F0BFDB4|nr:cytochrome b/b6 domain-containing protein [Aurantiacibacter odishensis]
MQAVERYSTGAIILHWLIALLLAGEIALGFAMPKDASGFAEYQLHKSIGITILALSLVRLGWRFTHPRPASLEGGATGVLASAVHVGFYVFMIAMPLTGWALVSTDPLDVPTILYGVVPLPHLPLSEGLNDLAKGAHEWLAWGGVALFVLHVAGAFRHHFLLHDDLLARMTFDGKADRALGTGGAVVAVGLITLFSVGGDTPEDTATPDQAEVAQADAGALEELPGEVADDESEAEAPIEEETTQAQDVEEAEAEPEAAAQEPSGPPPNWTIQPGGSLRFTATNSGAALNGSFGKWSGNIVMDPEAPQSAQITIRVDLASASLGDATQDNMLRGGDFFDTASFPQGVWRSTAVRRVSGNRYEADGTLSLKGISRSQRITFTLQGSGNRRSVQGSATIDRNAFSVGTGTSAENLAGSVQVTFAFDATS